MRRVVAIIAALLIVSVYLPALRAASIYASALLAVNDGTISAERLIAKLERAERIKHPFDLSDGVAVEVSVRYAHMYALTDVQADRLRGIMEVQKRKSITLHPNQAVLRHELAWIAGTFGDDQLEVDELRAASRLAPANATYRLQLARALLRARETDEAMTIFNGLLDDRVMMLQAREGVKAAEFISSL